MQDKILCETPTPGKSPTRIDKWKYDKIKEAVLACLPSSGEGALFKGLPDAVVEFIGRQEMQKIGSAAWYTTTVKLDLECKGVIRRINNSSPQRLIRTS